MEDHVLQLFKNYVLELGFAMDREEKENFKFYGEIGAITVFHGKDGRIYIYSVWSGSCKFEDWGKAKRTIKRWSFF